ncbi:MAG: hypothetical protein KY455_05585 [Euryarchaeota archaeon]|nr:hypothetical protein [Euryarchaeota archaeon]
MRCVVRRRPIVVLILILILLAQTVLGADPLSDDCRDRSTCDAVPEDDGPFPPLLVTGHTVYAAWTGVHGVVRTGPGATAHGDPDPEAPGGLPTRIPDGRLAQAECIVWVTGERLSFHPAEHEAALLAEDGSVKPIIANDHPSDADEDDPRFQERFRDHDPDHEGVGCDADLADPAPPGLVDWGLPTDFAALSGLFTPTDGRTTRFAAAVEAGDCAPGEGSSLRFRAHLDFIDPWGVPHEVVEFDHVCPPALEVADDALHDTFPDASDRYGQEGCKVREPTVTEDAVYTDLGGHCAALVSDRTRERFWLTATHAPVYEPTIGRYYSFALVVDTCAAVNDQDLEGRDGRYDVDGTFERVRRSQATVLGAGGVDQRPVDRCTDGSSLSFDDTLRRRVEHLRPPAEWDEVLRGNALNTNLQSLDWGTHRPSCRSPDLVWPHNEAPYASSDCYAEDHMAAAVDLHLFEEDPTGLWNWITKELR